jgi:hypothetical protein
MDVLGIGVGGIGLGASALSALLYYLVGVYQKNPEYLRQEELITDEQQEELLQKLSEGYDRSGKQSFYIIIDNKTPPELKRTWFRFDSKSRSYVEQGIPGGVFGPNIQKSEVKWVDSEGTPVELDYATLFEWNSASYKQFIENRSVGFARQVASRLGFTYDWKKLFENPNNLITKYFQDAQPNENFLVFNDVNIKSVIDNLLAAIGEKVVDSDKVRNAKQIARNKIVDTLEILEQVDRVGEYKRFLARELFLTSLFHSPFLVFEPVLQGAIDSTLFELREWVKLPENTSDKVLFTDLINSDCSIIFAEAVAELMIYSNKSVGLSTPKGRLLSHNWTYIQTLNRLRKVYKYSGEFLEVGTNKLHEKLSDITKLAPEETLVSPETAKQYLYIPPGTVQLGGSP